MRCCAQPQFVFRPQPVGGALATAPLDTQRPREVVPRRQGEVETQAEFAPGARLLKAYPRGADQPSVDDGKSVAELSIDAAAGGAVPVSGQARQWVTAHCP